MKIPKLKCKRCGHEWFPRIPDVRKCPNRECQSTRWNDDFSPEEEAKWEKRKKKKKDPEKTEKPKKPKKLKKSKKTKKTKKEMSNNV